MENEGCPIVKQAQTTNHFRQTNQLRWRKVGPMEYLEQKFIVTYFNDVDGSVDRTEEKWIAVPVVEDEV